MWPFGKAGNPLEPYHTIPTATITNRGNSNSNQIILIESKLRGLQFICGINSAKIQQHDEARQKQNQKHETNSTTNVTLVVVVVVVDYISLRGTSGICP